MELPPPPGYSSTGSALVHADASREADPNLRIKRCWDLALGPFKQVINDFPSGYLNVYVSSGSHEPVHHVHVWKFHLHLSHHDGRHDDVQVLDKYFSIGRLNLYRQALEDSVLSETSFQGF